MSDPLLQAMSDFMDAVDARLNSAREEFQRMAEDLRAAVPVAVAGLPGERGEPGARGEPGPIGERGPVGERGADGIGTREELDARDEERFRDFKVRTLADSYRGVYKHGEQYQRGDAVTWNGSLFLADKPTQGRPDGGTDWWQITSKGRDGKDARK